MYLACYLCLLTHLRFAIWLVFYESSVHLITHLWSEYSSYDLLSHWSTYKIPKKPLFLSYQASLYYNPKEFLGVITKWRRCWGEEIEAQLPWETTRSSFDDRERHLLVVIIYLATPWRTNSVVTPLKTCDRSRKDHQKETSLTETDFQICRLSTSGISRGIVSYL